MAGWQDKGTAAVTTHSPPRRHHYVPKFHIRRFADERGKVHAYDRTQAKHRRNQSPRNVLIKRDLYRATTLDEDQQFEIEHILALGEAKWSEAIRSIVKQGVVSIDLIPDIAEYLAFQHVRTLQHRYDMRAVMDHFAAGIEVMELRARSDANELAASEKAAADDFIREVNEGEIRVREPEDNVFAQQMFALPPIIEALQDGWHYIVVSLGHPEFVLSDHPVTLLGDWDGTVSTGVGFDTAEEIWMPLDPLRALVLSRDFTHPRHIFALSRTHASKINERLVLESSRWTIYRPGTDPLKNMTIPKQPPRMFVDEFAVPAAGSPQSETLLEIGKERPRVEDERLVIGRRLRPFPHRSHKVLDDDPWVPDARSRQSTICRVSILVNCHPGSLQDCVA